MFLPIRAFPLLLVLFSSLTTSSPAPENPSGLLYPEQLAESPLSGLVNIIGVFKKSTTKPAAPATWWKRTRRALSCRRLRWCRTAYNAMVRGYVRANRRSVMKNQHKVYMATMKHGLFMAEAFVTASRLSKLVVSNPAPVTPEPMGLEMPGTFPSFSSASTSTATAPDAMPGNRGWPEQLGRLGKLLVHGVTEGLGLINVFFPSLGGTAYSFLQSFLLKQLHDWNISSESLHLVIQNFRIWEKKTFRNDINRRASEGIASAVERYLKLESPEEMEEGRKVGIDNLWRSKMSGGHFLDASYATRNRCAFAAVEPVFKNIAAQVHDFLQHIISIDPAFVTLSNAASSLRAELARHADKALLLMRLFFYILVRRGSYLALTNPFGFAIKGSRKVDKIPGVRLKDLAAQALYYAQADCRSRSLPCNLSVDLRGMGEWHDDQFLRDEVEDVFL
ncbi:hypothetical protein BJ684DRAFT_16816 [Piptocephalis cylindrospora]|uniref:Uncharacterized protein n=1 Tax=Piptocephalis cylindrospora TaxID=1907219 RepID=A0A4P9Y3M8_9FUNG|nr:hypothetical protein BJ684DRAFT_16816 [Piptocephalis cylindrospora]|eukprot:RKP12731.1 hypothetical protein BJ684DRAFT_16816 [Piptocephalis cylindrospora]